MQKENEALDDPLLRGEMKNDKRFSAALRYMRDAAGEFTDALDEAHRHEKYNEYGSALYHYYRALELNPTSVMAKDGLKRVYDVYFSTDSESTEDNFVGDATGKYVERVYDVLYSAKSEDNFVGDAMGKYVERGSSAVGNIYKIQATVTDVYSHGEKRIFKVQTRDSKSLGLFVPGGTKLDANVRAGMEYVFEVEGRNGTKPDGSSVKGVLIVKQAKAK